MSLGMTGRAERPDRHRILRTAAGPRLSLEPPSVLASLTAAPFSPPPCKSTRFRPRQCLSDDIDLNGHRRARRRCFNGWKTPSPPHAPPEALVRWLDDHDEVDAALRETAARAYIALTCQTDDPARERAYLHHHRTRRAVAEAATVRAPKGAGGPSALCRALPSPHYDVFRRTVANRVRLYREENVPRETEEARLGPAVRQAVRGA